MVKASALVAEHRDCHVQPRLSKNYDETAIYSKSCSPAPGITSTSTKATACSPPPARF